MRRLLTMTWMLAIVLMVGFGCGKGSKVNLTGLTENAPGSMSEDGTKGATPSVNVLGDEDPGLVPLANAATADGAGSAAGALNGSAADGLAGIDPNQPAAGAWQDTRDALNGAALNGQDFVKNGNYWNEKVYFDFNRYEVRPSERVKLDGLAEHLRANPTFRVVIEGHCDERGSDEYNRSLSERRSLSVQNYLQNLGIDPARMQTISYGEDHPAVPNAKSEQEHQMNRRAEFLVGLPQ